MKKIIRIVSHIVLPSLILNVGIDSFHNNLTSALTTSPDPQTTSVTADITTLKEIKTPPKSLWQFLSYWQSIINTVELEQLQNSAKLIIKELREKPQLEIENSELQNSIAILNEFVQKSLDLLEAKQGLPEFKNDDYVVAELSSVNPWNKLLVILNLWKNPQEVFTSLNETSLSISTKRKIREFITAINDLQAVVLTKLIKLSPVLLIKFEPIPQIEKSSAAADQNIINLEKQLIQKENKENVEKISPSPMEQSQLSSNPTSISAVESQNTQPATSTSLENQAEQVIGSLPRETQVLSINHRENPLSTQQNPLSTSPTPTKESASTEKIATPLPVSESNNIPPSPIPQTAVETSAKAKIPESKPAVSNPVIDKAETRQVSLNSDINPSPKQSSDKPELSIVEPLQEVSEKETPQQKNSDNLETAEKVSVEFVPTEKMTEESETSTNNTESQDIKTDSSSLDNDTTSKVADIPANESPASISAQITLPAETANSGNSAPSDFGTEQPSSSTKLNEDSSTQQQTIDFSQCTDVNGTIKMMEGLIDRVEINKLTPKQKSILKKTTDLINEIQIHPVDLNKKYSALTKLYGSWEQLRTNVILDDLAPKLPKNFHEKLIYSLYTEYLENIYSKLETLKNNPKFSAVHIEINALYTTVQRDLTAISENIKAIINAPRQNLFAIKSVEENKMWEKLNKIATECSLLENKIRNLPIRFVKRESDILSSIKTRPLFIDKLLHSKTDSAQKQSFSQRIPNSTIIKPLAAPIA